jgi:molecular chaperone HscB
LRGAPIDAENNTAMPAQFLMEQMEWREALDDASSETSSSGRVEADAARAHAGGHRAAAGPRAGRGGAAQQVRALMFIERFAHDVEARFDQLGQ